MTDGDIQQGQSSNNNESEQVVKNDVKDEDKSVESTQNADSQTRQNGQTDTQPQRETGGSEKKTVYEQLTNDLANNSRTMKEITMGKRIGFYRIRGELGSGNFSQVKLGIHLLTKEKVAVKILDKSRMDGKLQKLLTREIQCMEKLHHPNVIRLYEVIETLAKMHIVMEYAGGGELFERISNLGRIPEEEAKPLYAQVVSAIDHMHDNGIIHRDIKADNVFFTSSKLVKVGDFGFSTLTSPDESLATFCGSPPYAAPELFRDDSYQGPFVDIWALGVLLYFMITSVMPFYADSLSKLKLVILDGKFTIPNYVSDEAKELITALLQMTPTDRLSMRKIRESDWLRGQEFPAALQPDRMLPSARAASISEDEQQARQVLKDLGIYEQHLVESRERESRSGVTGAYRIILHKLHKKASELCVIDEVDAPASKQTNKRTTETKQSKTCVLL